MYVGWVTSGSSEICTSQRFYPGTSEGSKQVGEPITEVHLEKGHQNEGVQAVGHSKRCDE